MLPEGVPPADQLLVDQPGDARASSPRTTAASPRRRTRVGRCRVAEPRRLPQTAAAEHRGRRTPWPRRPGGHPRALDLVRSRRHVGQPATELQAARPGRRTRRVRHRAGDLRPAACRPASRRSAPRQGTSASPLCPRRCSAIAARSASSASARTSDGEGPEVRDRRGLRLDRAVEALHDRDDGALPGPALPRQLDPRSTRRRTASTRTTIGTTTARPPYAPVVDGLDRRAARRSRRSARRSITGTRISAAKMMWTGAWRRPHSY